MLNRRTFLTTAAGAAAAVPGFAKSATKRDRMLAWVAGKPTPGYTPAAFFLHFAPEFKDGSAAAKKHLEFFRQTDMDFVKIQCEQSYKPQPQLQTPADWAKVQPYKLADYEPLLVTVRDLMKAVKCQALIVMTLYSPYMSAGHCATKPVFLRHLEENPGAVKRGLEILTESHMVFVRACIKEGVDGFYMSTQGSETGQLSRPELLTR
ncbi:MAG: hypothetical protein FJW31_11880 [Acidobacteria bacterium]|nr:hypothetical protein [Acidobacteriota bacterium]